MGCFPEPQNAKYVPKQHCAQRNQCASVCVRTYFFFYTSEDQMEKSPLSEDMLLGVILIILINHGVFDNLFFFIMFILRPYSHSLMDCYDLY